MKRRIEILNEQSPTKDARFGVINVESKIFVVGVYADSRNQKKGTECVNCFNNTKEFFFNGCIPLLCGG
jgi:hypothetical protein